MNYFQGLPNGVNPDLMMPAMHGEAVTPSDSAELTNVSRALIIGTAGNLTVVMADGTTLLITGCPAGVIPIRVKQVKSTGTAAVGITSIW